MTWTKHESNYYKLEKHDNWSTHKHCEQVWSRFLLQFCLLVIALFYGVFLLYFPYFDISLIRNCIFREILWTLCSPKILWFFFFVFRIAENWGLLIWILPSIHVSWDTQKKKKIKNTINVHELYRRRSHKPTNQSKWSIYGSEFWTMYNWPFSDLEHFYYTWFAPSYSETISFGIVVKSTIRAFRKHILYIPLLIFVHHTGLQLQKKFKKSCFYTFSFFRNHPVNFQATLLILSNYSVNLACLGPVS